MPLIDAHRVTVGIAVLLAMASAAGLSFGPQGLYDRDPSTLPAFIGQDAITLLLALPCLVLSAAYARRGSIRARLCWIGTLLYIADPYTFYVLGARFSVLFPVHIAIVSMSMYGALALFFVFDFKALAARCRRRGILRMTAGFLTAVSLFFAVLWLQLLVSRLAAGGTLDAVARIVIALDGVVLLPLLFVSGRWLWQGHPLGYALGGLLLVKAVLTFLTLGINTLVVAAWGQPIDPVQSSAFGVGTIAASVLLGFYMRSVDDRALS